MLPKKRLRLEKGQRMLFSALSDKGKKGASDEVNTETGESATSAPSLDPVSDPTPEITNQSPGQYMYQYACRIWLKTVVWTVLEQIEVVKWIMIYQYVAFSRRESILYSVMELQK